MEKLHLVVVAIGSIKVLLDKNSDTRAYATHFSKENNAISVGLSAVHIAKTGKKKIRKRDSEEIRCENKLSIFHREMKTFSCLFSSFREKCEFASGSVALRASDAKFFFLTTDLWDFTIVKKNIRLSTRKFENIKCFIEFRCAYSHLKALLLLRYRIKIFTT